MSNSHAVELNVPLIMSLSYVLQMQPPVIDDILGTFEACMYAHMRMTKWLPAILLNLLKSTYLDTIFLCLPQERNCLKLRFATTFARHPLTSHITHHLALFMAV